MGSAIWSTSLKDMLHFPAKTFLQFFDNHGLLTVNQQPKWYTVTGGSKEYVKKLTQSFHNKIHLNCGIKKVIRSQNGEVILQDTHNQEHIFDKVIFACHTDEILDLLQDPTDAERDILNSIRYQANDVVLHSDTNFMPKCRKAWSSWNYLSEEKENQKSTVSLSYWMNNLQPLKTEKPIIVTLNPSHMPESDTIYDKCQLSHPVFNQSALEAQQKLSKIQGKLNTWYCGAWTRYGFHEDGLLSAVKIAEAMGVEAPWI